MVVNERYPTYNTVTAPTIEPTQYEMPDEVMRWQPPECFICHKHKSFYVSMPWGSDYNGEVVCGDCCHKHYDPATKAALAEKEGKNER